MLHHDDMVLNFHTRMYDWHLRLRRKRGTIDVIRTQQIGELTRASSATEEAHATSENNVVASWRTVCSCGAQVAVRKRSISEDQRHGAPRPRQRERTIVLLRLVAPSHTFNAY